jgi:N-terminal domain of ribose phosphate pyrophosphokinase
MVSSHFCLATTKNQDFWNVNITHRQNSPGFFPPHFTEWTQTRRMMRLRSSGAAALLSGVATMVGLGVVRNDEGKVAETNAARKHACTNEKKFNSNCGDFKIFSGSAHTELANNIAKNLGTSLSPAAIGRFNDGEVSIKVRPGKGMKNVERELT